MAPPASAGGRGWTRSSPGDWRFEHPSAAVPGQAPHGQRRGASGRPRAAGGASAPVGAVAAVRAATCRCLPGRRALGAAHLPRSRLRSYAAWAKRRGLGKAPTGAIYHVQRFGSSINLHIHFHSMLLDGVFTRDEAGRPVFHPAPPPQRRELEEVLRRLHRRAVAWLRRRGLMDAAVAGRVRGEQASLDACISAAVQRGTVRTMHDGVDDEDRADETMQSPPSEAGAVELDGFNLHARVAIAGDDDPSRERLLRDGAPDPSRARTPAPAARRTARLPDQCAVKQRRNR